MRADAIWAVAMAALGVVGVKWGNPWIGGFNLLVAALFVHNLIHDYEDGKRW